LRSITAFLWLGDPARKLEIAPARLMTAFIERRSAIIKRTSASIQVNDRREMRAATKVKRAATGFVDAATHVDRSTIEPAHPRRVRFDGSIGEKLRAFCRGNRLKSKVPEPFKPHDRVRVRRRARTHDQ